MIADRLLAVQSTINQACEASGRQPEEVLLLAVSKRHPPAAIVQAYDCGQRHFGENYLSEALEKQQELLQHDMTWHFIGHIQSNKTRKVAENFSWAHAVDSLKIAKRLSDQRPEGMEPLNICLQINIDNEETKSGLSPDEGSLISVATEVAQLPNVHLRGLMCIPSPKEDAQAELETFNKMAHLQRVLQDQGIAVDTLSMGMSGDIHSAIVCGATIVRVGTAIFGAREKL